MMVILASASPRREAILSLLGLPFRVEASTVEECNEAPVPPQQLVVHHACSKAQEVARRSPGAAVVIGADTVVVCDGKVLGKPADAADAKRMLGLLAGRTHQVYTGLSVVAGGKVYSHCEQTQVEMGPLSAEEIEAYVDGGEPLDKAGAYAIQGRGARFVRGIQGCYQNVVGLPLFALVSLLRQAGLSV